MQTPSWLRPGARVWLAQTYYRVHGFGDEGGLILESVRPGAFRFKFSLTAEQLQDALERGALRPTLSRRH